MRPYGRSGGRFGDAPFGRGGRWDGHGGRQRGLAAGELRLVLQAMIALEPRHGYDLMRLIEEQTGGAYVPSAGVIYPALAMLEDQGQIASCEPAAGRKAYAITEAGAAEVAARTAEIAVLNARLAALGGGNREQHAPVRRAMDNLKLALGHVLAAPGPETPHAIAKIIDEAAQQIERLG